MPKAIRAVRDIRRIAPTRDTFSVPVANPVNAAMG